MSNRRNTVASSIAIAGLFIFANPANATDLADIGLENEVNACVAEVRDHADLTDAVRLRHDVVAIERRIVGYTLNISTSVYGAADADAIRAYTATCVVNGDNKPLRFTISQKS